MATVWLVLVVVLVIAGLVFGVVSLLANDDPGLVPAEPDGRARPLPNDRSLHESDLEQVRFDVGLRGYRMPQVDRMVRRTAYDLGYKDEMIAVLEAEVAALREGRLTDADVLRHAREEAASPQPTPQVKAADLIADEDDEDERVPDFHPRHDRSGETGTASASAVDAAATDAHEASDTDQDTDSDTDDDGRPGAAHAKAEPEPREGSLRRRNPVPDGAELARVEAVLTLAEAGPQLPEATANGANADGAKADGTRADGVQATSAGDEGAPEPDEPKPVLEAADRPAHA